MRSVIAPLQSVISELHNEQRLYPDPFEFKPERFLKDGQLNFDAARDPMFAAFGFGRRSVVRYSCIAFDTDSILI